jgi:hypothetical protein
MNRISEDVSKVRMYVGPAVMYSINTIIRFTIVIVYMYNVLLDSHYIPITTAITVVRHL